MGGGLIQAHALAWCILCALPAKITAKLPTLTENKPSYHDVKNFPLGAPNPEYEEGEILINYKFDIDHLTYMFEHAGVTHTRTERGKNLFKWIYAGEFGISSESARLNTKGQNCKDLFSPGTIYYKQLSAYWVGFPVIPGSSKYVNLPVVPSTDDEFNLELVRSCCNPSTCSEKNYVVSLTKDVRFAIFNQASLQTVLAGQCDFCAIGPGITTCSHGTYATARANFDTESSLQLSQISCNPCAPGSWNTCRQGGACVWTIPEAGNYNVGTSIPEIHPPPVGKCFDCKLAKDWRTHYMNSSSQYVLDDAVDTWYCAGGAYPPQACPSGDYVPNTGWTDCVCRNGTYTNPDDKKRCLPCPAGHYCMNNASIACPKHYYQDETGKSECKRCTATADDFGIFNGCLEGNKQLQFCDPAYPETQNKPLGVSCQSCAKCRKAYLPAVEGQVDCYRFYPSQTT